MGPDAGIGTIIPEPGKAAAVWEDNQAEGCSSAGTGAPDSDNAIAARNEWSVLEVMERGDIGTRRTDGAVSVRRDERGVCILYGPFWRLSQGTYRLSIDCRIGEPKIRSAVVLGVEIIAETRLQVAWRDFTAGELAMGSGEVDFVVPPQLSHDAGGAAIFEFRLFHFGNADIVVGAIMLRCLAPESGRISAPRWRLSGQSDPRRARPPDADGFVAVSRRAPAGQFLRRVGLFAGLPAARYRLRFRCRVEAPRAARRPMLSVEIVNGYVSHETYFFLAELAAGWGSIDFAVPAELGMECGAPAPVAVRFIHLRNATLAIGAIELVLLDEDGVRVPDMPTLHSEVVQGRVGQDLSAPPPRRQTLVADPLRVSLPPGQVTFDLHPSAGRLEVGAAPALSVELRAGGGKWRPWHRLMFRRRATSAAAGRRARWDFTSREVSAGGCSIEFDVPPEWSSGAGREAAVEVRIINQCESDLALAKLNLKKIRQNPQKDLMIVGNCHAALVYEAFRAIPALQRYFRARYHNVNLQEHFYEQARRDLQNCNLLVVQDVGDWEDCPLREWVPDRAETIMFPSVHFASLWPFDSFNGPTDRHAIAREAPNFTFTYLDGLLARLRTELPDRECRFDAYRSLNSPGIINYVRLHQFEARRMLALDKKYECEIGRYILDRFQSEQIFYTTNHPNRRILELMMANIMRTLGITGEIPHIAALDQLHTMQVPVHPKVAEALGVRWATPERKYRFRQEELTWEQYVRRYIEHYG